MYSNDEEETEGNTGFPLSIQNQSEIKQIVNLIRNHLVRMSLSELRAAAATLLALKRLPLTTKGVRVSFGFRQTWSYGNYAWADINISEDHIRLTIGEHFYGPAVGGDTESETIFEAFEGDERCQGSIQRWLDTAQEIAHGSAVTSEDYSDYEQIDWCADEVD